MARGDKRPTTTPRLRCAIYTRKSSDEGLEQSFNSLHAQRESCEAYVLSQAGEGWSALTAQYNDGGYSGGNMDRPGLAQLLADVDAGRIDIVVVYKVDRLTRSLTDFAKIVERFDARGASFVSVTQAFNTTTSMGRLTLNVLLSFAQFEREVTGERIRDKIAASKAKGMWMGGNVPLGYDTEGRALVVNPVEAEHVRLIFDRYLALGSVHALRDELAARGVLSKQRVTKAGVTIGGKEFARGALFHLLSNRHYLGEIVHKDKVYPGEHSGIVDREVFEKAQLLLAEHAGALRRAKAGLAARAPSVPLAGLVYDDRGNRMSSVAGRKPKGQIYRYYVSTALQLGRRHDAGTLPRFPGPALEELLTDRLTQIGAIRAGEALSEDVRRVVVSRDRVVVKLDTPPDGGQRWLLALKPQERLDIDDGVAVLTIPAILKWRGGSKLAVGPGGSRPYDTPRVDPVLLKGLVRGEGWKRQMLAGAYPTVEALAVAEKVSHQYARALIRLGFLSPRLKRAILEGKAPPATNLQTFVQKGVPLAWADQLAQVSD